jgi:VanZ family protein
VPVTKKNTGTDCTAQSPREKCVAEEMSLKKSLKYIFIEQSNTSSSSDEIEFLIDDYVHVMTNFSLSCIIFRLSQFTVVCDMFFFFALCAK